MFRKTVNKQDSALYKQRKLFSHCQKASFSAFLMWTVYLPFMTDYKDLAYPLPKCCILHDSFLIFLATLYSLSWYDTCFWNAVTHAKLTDSWTDRGVFWISLLRCFIRVILLSWWMLQGQEMPAGRNRCLQEKTYIKLTNNFHKGSSKED